jgi:putative methionine-R-sulfoxide reductase with GAF domain
LCLASVLLETVQIVVFRRCKPIKGDLVIKFFGGEIALKWVDPPCRLCPRRVQGLQNTKKIVNEQKNKPVLDQQNFEKLLEAAYVIQEHNRGLQEMEASLELHCEQLREQDEAAQAALPRSDHAPEERGRTDSDYTLTLAEIVEAQHQIQMRHLEPEKAMALIAERVARITNASGAAIAILEGKIIRYRAGAGTSALPTGSEVPLETAICASSVRTGQVLRTQDVSTEFMFDPELCRKRKIQSLVTVPVYHDGGIVGALELYFHKVHGFAEQDIHTCQLMAGLVTETIGRNAESALKKSMAAERSQMLAAIEKLTPNLAALAEEKIPEISDKLGASAEDAKKSSACWRCGSNVVAEEQFCGKCGAPRVGDNDPSSLQSKVASAWHKQLAGQDGPATVPQNGSSAHQEASRSAAVTTVTSPRAAKEAEDDLLLHSFLLPKSGEDDPGVAQTIDASADAEEAPQLPASANLQLGDDLEAGLEPSPTALLKPGPQDVTWSSAAKARDFLEMVAGTRSPNALGRFWRARRGDFYLALAVVLVLIVIRWGILSSHSVGATGHGTAAPGSALRSKQPAPDTDISTFDKLLISLGLAEAPETPEYKGNPETQVWIDLHTALYYCPDSDLYGKTPQGKFASQRDAQLDQFEPASRKPCD